MPPPFNRQLWGVALVDDKGTLLYGRNADRLFVPASNTKLVVSAVAAALFPPDFTVNTSVYANGPVVNGVLQGDLVLYGRGDPTFGERCYAIDTTAAGACDTEPDAEAPRARGAARARGVTTVTGDLVGDGSWFEPMIVHPAWEVYDLNWWYAAPVSGLGFNDNSIDFKYSTGDTRRPARDAHVHARLRRRHVREPDPHRSPRAGRDHRLLPHRRDAPRLGPGQRRGRARKPRTEYFALPDPDLFAARALRAALAAQGIAVLGATRSTTDSMTFEIVRRGTPLAEVTSRPLKDWIFPILNTSQNWYAEMTLKQLGRQFGAPAAGTRAFASSAASSSTRSGGLDPVRAAGRLRAVGVQPGEPARLHAAAAVHPDPSPHRDVHRRAAAVGPARVAQDPVRRHADRGTGARQDRQHQPHQHPVGLRRARERQGLTFSVQANHHTLPSAAMLAQIDSVVVEMVKGR